MARILRNSALMYKDIVTKELMNDCANLELFESFRLQDYSSYSVGPFLLKTIISRKITLNS
jgi:hypothetical protein